MAFLLICQGILVLRFYSSDTYNLLKCNPNWELRMALRAIVLVDITPQNLERFPQLQRTNLRDYIRSAAIKAGTELTFDEEEH